jgi:RimJ/RimL family protein N-acetyltransferase
MLSTDRLLLRLVVESDGHAMHAMLSGPKVRRHVPVAPPTEEEARESVQVQIDGRQADPHRDVRC